MQNRLFMPSEDISKTSNMRSLEEYKGVVSKIADDYEGYWDKLAKSSIEWAEPYEKVLDDSNAPFYKWFVKGKLNVAHQCTKRHLKDKKNKVAILFEGELGDSKAITYLELYQRVNQLSNILTQELKIKKGDRVILYMPMIPEVAISMLACAQIGAIHSVVFGGFSVDALKDRILDSNPKLIITADGAFRRGKPYMLKPIVDEALKRDCDFVKNVLVVRRNHQKIKHVVGRDYVYNELMEGASKHFIPPFMDSEDPLFLLYTSGSTGKPKGIVHSQAGYIMWAHYTMRNVFEVKDQDTYWCTADVGWITGHTYLIYGPLSAGLTTVLYEGTPTFPNIGRWWEIIEKYKVNQFYTAPTAIRLLRKEGFDVPSNYNLSSLKVLGSVGEPINSDAWIWFYEKVGNRRCPIVDTWWQTETGGHMISPLPGATPLKPESATFPLPGIQAEILDENGDRARAGEKGYLCVTKPWPSMLRNIWKDENRFKKTYFRTFPNGKTVYFSSDGAIYDKDDYIFITGRIDDVVNVSGHRIGTAEVETVISHHESVSEVAVVAKPHSIKGESLCAFIVPRQKLTKKGKREATSKINKFLISHIGAFAKCDDILFVDGIPKTRSGKIMRRILRAIAKCEEIKQDLSTLEDPKIVDKIKVEYEKQL